VALENRKETVQAAVEPNFSERERTWKERQPAGLADSPSQRLPAGLSRDRNAWFPEPQPEPACRHRAPALSDSSKKHLRQHSPSHHIDRGFCRLDLWESCPPTIRELYPRLHNACRPCFSGPASRALLHAGLAAGIIASESNAVGDKFDVVNLP
jgi:hypothetical protein